MENNQITITTEDGKDIICEILFTHHSDEFNKDYVVFVQVNTNEASAATFIPTEDGQGNLGMVETEEEWAMLEGLLEQYAQNMEEHDHDHSACASCAHADHCTDDCDCGE